MALSSPPLHNTAKGVNDDGGGQVEVGAIVAILSAMTLILDGNNLTVEQLVTAARDPGVRVGVSTDAHQRVAACRALVDRAVKEYLAATTEAEQRSKAVYGVTTGFGEFKSVLVDKRMLRQLQENILLSHSIGFGVDEDPDNPANYFAADVMRAVMILRVNAFLKGHSGVRSELVYRVLEMINGGIVPLVPVRGSLGSSGDLCPLAHTFATLLGEGWYYTVKSVDDTERGFVKTSKKPASDLKRFELAEKEGLALTNGAVFCTALLALSVHDAKIVADSADAAVALALDAIQGRIRAFDDAVHQSRGMAGQIESAKNVRELVRGSKLVGLRQNVQDAYSVRCAPQVHGASRDAIAYACRVVEAEMNAATDNPLFFPGHVPEDSGDARNPQLNHEPLAFSAGNFHGQPIGLAADFLAIAVAEFANISERRIQMLLDKNHNNGLPANLVADGGLNSGLMIGQYTAASLVSENKVLCHPASVDSIPSSANIEDHVAMATIAARKLRQVLANARAVLAIEFMTAVQAIEWRMVRMQSSVGNEQAEMEKHFGDDSRTGQTWIREHLGTGNQRTYFMFRRDVPPVIVDRYLEPAFRAARRVISRGAIPDGH